jgi:hypothetical protein
MSHFNPTPIGKPRSYKRMMYMFVESMPDDAASEYFIAQAVLASRVAREVYLRRVQRQFVGADLVLANAAPHQQHMANVALERYFRPTTTEMGEADVDYVPATPRSINGETDVQEVPETPIRDLDQFHEIKQHDPNGPPSVDFGPVQAAREPEALQLDEQPAPPQVRSHTPVRSSPRFAGPVTRQKARHRAAKRPGQPLGDRDDNNGRVARRRL